MPSLIIVDDPGDWPSEIPGAQIVPARRYLTEPEFSIQRSVQVYNLCRSYRYQSLGYYVSLLAAARGQKPVPGVQTMQDLKTPVIVRTVSDDLDRLIQKQLGHLQAREFTLSIYFGRNIARHYDRLSGQLYTLFQAPLMRGQFIFSDKQKKWLLQGLSAISLGEVSEEHREFIFAEARDFFQRKQKSRGQRKPPRYNLAILCDPGEAEAPSNERALLRFEKAAASLGFSCERIGRDDFGRIGSFDALLIRETTSVLHHTYRFARRAAAEGVVVIDDPESILRCTNKVFLAELLSRHKVPIPKTLVIHRGNRNQVVGELGLPVILKQPDSSFSQGVVKVETEAELKKGIEQLLQKSELIIGQEFLPTTFDWRIGIFDRQPLYACRYYMAKHHWQILKRDGSGRKTDEGMADTIPVEHVPTPVLRVALKAANLIGDGLYGVDLKQVGEMVYVIEINDNPNIDAGIEDKILKNELYLRIMRVMARRVESRGGR